MTQIILFLIQVLAGTGVFLVGVHLLTANIEQLATRRIRDLFQRTADKRLINVGIGAGVTALINSSGVTTVLIVGFVNVGLMNLYQATAMIMGANIGTTVTAQIAALSAFPISSYITLVVFIGVMMTMICKKDMLKKLGFILAGLGLIFIGLGLMSDSMKANLEAVQSVLVLIKNPILLFFLGAFLTALVQSSSATTSVLIAMSVAGLTVGTGGNEVLFLILGTNVGSCVTALMSSIGAGTNAKRAGLIHLMFNTVGSALFFVLLLLWPDFMKQTFGSWFGSMATQIAMFHTFFNVVCTLLFLPFCNLFVKVSQRLIPEKQKAVVQTYLDERMLSSSSLALSQLNQETVLLSDTAMEAFRLSWRSFREQDESLIAPTRELIERATVISSGIINYLIRLSAQSKLSEERRISVIHGNVGDAMRIAEIADNLTKYTRTSVDRSLHFSSHVKSELNEMVGTIEKLYGLTRKALLEGDDNLTAVDVTEEQIDAFRKRLIDNHIDRLNRGECRAESSSVFINLVSNLERLGDHLTYIAHSVQENEA